jgi:hypothetical protein
MIRAAALSAMFVSAAIAALPVPPVSVRATYKEKPVKLSEAETRTLQSGVEKLVASCAGAHTPAAAKRHAELEVGVHYAAPRTLATADPARREIAVSDIVLDASSDVNEGRPTVYVVAGREAQQLDRCDESLLQATLCVAPLEHLAPLKVREGCRLTPR